MNGWRILVVEDERLVYRVVADALRTAGFPCEVVHRASEVVARLEAKPYDLVILDIRLPDLPGSEVLRQIRERDPHLPVILITAYALDRELEKALAHAPDAVLYKPFEIEALLATVRRLLMRPALPTHAIVSMEARAGAPLTESVSPVSARLVWLSWESNRLVASPERMDDRMLCLQTPSLETAVPPQVCVEWYGEDALYQFRSRVVEHRGGTETDLWLIRQPQVIRRIQRRRYPRIPARGRVALSPVGRIQRSIWGQLVDLSEGGAGALVYEEVGRDTAGMLTIEWETPGGALAFQIEGVVCHMVAGMQAHQPVYRLGIAFREAVPQSVRKALRTLQIERLLAASP